MKEIILRQSTLKKRFTIEFENTHYKKNIRITFNPAIENYGYKIKRTDIGSLPLIDIIPYNFTAEEHGTISSVDNNIHIHNIGDALAALYICEIDNCLIEINADEFPVISDAREIYIDHIKKAGVVVQHEYREYEGYNLCLDVIKNKINTNSDKVCI